MGGIVDEILGGQHDESLARIEQAVGTRKRYLFRPGAQVRISGARNASINGKTGTVIRVNPKRVTVGIGAKNEYGWEHEYLIPITMLEVLS